MKIESEIFKRCTILYDQLIPYGFKKNNNRYILTKTILDDSFRVEIEITNGKVNGKIYDVQFEEEYVNYRIEEVTGEFVHKVRDEFEKILLDIRTHCTISTYFETDQANRIAEYIFEQYHDKPEFLWKKYPGYGVFKNAKSNKWYGLIANICKSKINGNDEREVEILNVKVQDVSSLLCKEGFYQAYHMNKENWVTIILDDTISDEEIVRYIQKSYQFTEKKKSMDK